MDKEHKKKVEEHALAGAATEVVKRFGSAIKEHFVALSGNDRENGTETTRSLKSISESKVSKEYKKTNIKQQAGFSAEVKSVAKGNADKIIMGEKKRVSRTDDVVRQTDNRGRNIGGTNDQLFDLVEVNPDGTIIEGTARQVKFVGGNAKSCAEVLLSKKYKKYRDSDVPIEIPSDFYDKVQADYAQRISKLDKQIQTAEAKGDTDLTTKLKNERNKIETTSKNLRKSNVKNKEAIFARKHPKLSTAASVVGVAHKAGVRQAGIGAVMSGSTSIIKNFVSCARGDIDPKDAAVEVVKETGKGAVYSYATAFSGTAIKGVMQNASSGYVRALSKTSLPTQMVSTTMNVGKVMKRYLSGEITGAQCIEQLGEDGFGELGAAMCSTMTVAAVQGVGNSALTIVAGAAGASIGYMAAVAVYQELSTSLKERELAVERRKQIEAECAEAVILIQQYRAEMIDSYEKYFTQHLMDFKNGMDAMDEAIVRGDIDGFLTSNAQIQLALGRKIQFSSQQEFDDLMISNEAFRL